MPPIVVRMKSAGRIGFVSVLMLLAASALAQNAHDKITDGAVWKIPANFVANAHKACAAGPAGEFSICFINANGEVGSE